MDRTKVGDWLFQQGVSTVLLVLLVIGIGLVVRDLRTLVPEGIDRVQAGYEKIRKDAATDRQVMLDRVTEAYREDQERDQEMLERLLAPCPFPDRVLTEHNDAVDGSTPSP